MEGVISYRFAPSRGSEEEDRKAAVRLMDRIGDTGYEEPGAIVHMQSFSLDRAKEEVKGWEGHGLLGYSVPKVTVAPAKTCLIYRFTKITFLRRCCQGGRCG
jgi:hypothetical protein